MGEFQRSDRIENYVAYRGHHYGNVNVMVDDLEFYGLVHGTVTVAPGRQLYMFRVEMDKPTGRAFYSSGKDRENARRGRCGAEWPIHRDR